MTLFVERDKMSHTYCEQYHNVSYVGLIYRMFQKIKILNSYFLK